MKQTLRVPDVRQTDNFSCGSAVAMSVGKFFGVGPDKLSEWKKLLGTSKADSTDPHQIAKVLKSFGVSAVPRTEMTIEDLHFAISHGKPVIVMAQEYGERREKGAKFAYGHYLICCGWVDDMLIFQDPSADNVIEGEGSDNAPGKVLIDNDKFMSVWHDKDQEGEALKRFGITCSKKGSFEKAT